MRLANIFFLQVLDFGYLPYMSGAGKIFNRFGRPFSARSILRGTELNYEAYSQSPLYMTTGYFWAFWAGMALAPAFLVHVFLYYRRFIWSAIKTGKAEEDDVHAAQMRKYPDTHRYFYPAILLIGVSLAIAAVQAFESGLPVWAMLIAVALSGLYTVPSGILFAQTTFFVSTNVISEFLIGYILPGRPVPNMLFKAYSVCVSTNAAYYLQGLKLGHYLKIPPKITAIALIGTLLWVNTIQIAIKQFFQGQVPDLCQPGQSASLTCPGHNSFYASSIIWGVIGPSRMFSGTALYRSLFSSVAVGAILPIPFYLLVKLRSQGALSILKYANVPAMFVMMFVGPSISPLNVNIFVVISFITQYWLRRRHFRLWDKWNYLTGAALDAGTIASGIIIFLALQLPLNGSISLNWIGQELSGNTRDIKGTAWKPIPEGGIPLYEVPR